MLVLSAVLGSPRRTAHAEQASTQYRGLITSALEEYEIANYEEALSLFQRAHAIEPNARTLRGMGMAAYQARKYVIAIDYLQASLVDERKPLTAQFRREVENALEAAQGFVVRFELVVTPRQARVMLDGEPVDGGARNILLDPGEHEIVATAPGYKTDSRRIKASSGRPGRIELQLLAGTPAPSGMPVPSGKPSSEPAAPASSTPEASPQVPVGFKVLASAGLSLALAGAVVGTVAGVKALSLEDKLGRVCPDKTCDSDHTTQLNHAKTWGTVSTVSLAVGGAGLAAGVVGLVLWIQRTRARDVRSQARLTPIMLAPGLGVRGSF